MGTLIAPSTTELFAQAFCSLATRLFVLTEVKPGSSKRDEGSSGEPHDELLGRLNVIVSSQMGGVHDVWTRCPAVAIGRTVADHPAARTVLALTSKRDNESPAKPGFFICVRDFIRNAEARTADLDSAKQHQDNDQAERNPEKPKQNGHACFLRGDAEVTARQRTGSASPRRTHAGTNDSSRD